MKLKEEIPHILTQVIQGFSLRSRYCPGMCLTPATVTALYRVHFRGWGTLGSPQKKKRRRCWSKAEGTDGVREQSWRRELNRKISTQGFGSHQSVESPKQRKAVALESSMIWSQYLTWAVEEPSNDNSNTSCCLTIDTRAWEVHN